MFMVLYFELFQEWILLTGVPTSCISPLRAISYMYAESESLFSFWNTVVDFTLYYK